ncbi:hypothetical protein VTL71DRAFT_3711 [Oculimacula yallundae]|uniref:Uncharacterized protein n=1 Tax=Oculimacula yallundae TaxID=86028 RepID=A0ABR4C3T6_9HELO
MAGKSRAFFVVCGAIQAYFDDGDSVSPMEHFDDALQTFRSELQHRHETFDVSTFSAGLLLCTLCLFQGRTWTMFLERMYVLYHLETSLGHLLPEVDHDEAIQHSIEVISIMDMEPMVIGRVSPSMGVWHRLRKVQEGWIGGKPGGIEIVSGIPRTLLDIIADIGRLDAHDIEFRLWAWPGDIGRNTQCILWDCWRYTAVLDVRRIERNKRKKQAALNIEQHEPGLGMTASFPSREIVMCRLASAIYALYRLLALIGNHQILVHHGLLYPLVIGSLEVPLLDANPDWKDMFKEIRAGFRKKETFRYIRLVDEILDEAWREGTDTFDIEEAARTRGIEIAVY